MSYSFDNTNDKLTGTFSSTYGRPLTIAVWFKHTHPGVIDFLAGLAASATSNNSSYNLRTAVASGADVNRYAYASIDNAAGIDSVNANNPVDGAWTPAIITDDGTDRSLTIGAVTGNIFGVSPTIAAVKHIRLGESFTSVQDYNGLLAEFAVWDKVLDAGEIAEYVAAGSPAGIAAANLVGYWPLSAESGTQENLGLDALGDLTVSGATFSADHPPISVGGSFTLEVVKADLSPVGNSIPLDKGMPVTTADLQTAGNAVTWALAASIVAAIPVFDPQDISLGFLVEGAISVDSAQPTFSAGDLTLALKMPVTKADLQPAPQSVNLIPTGVLRVDSGTPTISGSDITPEIAKFFDVGTLGLAGRDVGLRRGTPVISASPTIAGSEITLTVPATLTMAVETASLSPAGQDVGFQITWVIPVTSASFDIDGINVELQFAIDDGLTVEPALASIVGQDIIGGIGIRVAEALPTIAPQVVSFILDQRIEVGFDEEGNETLTQVGFAGQDITLESTFTLGLVVEAGEFSIVGQDISRHIGSGAPTTIKGYYSSWAAHGSFSAPIAVGDATSEQIAKVG